MGPRPARPCLRDREGNHRRLLRPGPVARVSGDRARDLDEPLRAEILDRLAAMGADDDTLGPVREYRELEAAQQGQALGDALPVGLRMVARE